MFLFCNPIFFLKSGWLCDEPLPVFWATLYMVVIYVDTTYGNNRLNFFIIFAYMWHLFNSPGVAGANLEIFIFLSFAHNWMATLESCPCVMPRQKVKDFKLVCK